MRSPRCRRGSFTGSSSPRTCWWKPRQARCASVRSIGRLREWVRCSWISPRSPPAAGRKTSGRSWRSSYRAVAQRGRRDVAVARRLHAGTRLLPPAARRAAPWVGETVDASGNAYDRTGSARRFTPPTGSGSEHGARVNGMTRSTRTAFLLLLVLGCTVPRVVAQTAVEVRGVVTDETGGLIVGAAVTLTGERGAKTSATTNHEGRYRVVTESPGKMTLTVEAAGFAPSTRMVTVTGAGSTTIDVKLRVAINDTCRCSRRAGRRVARFGTEPFRDQAVGQGAGSAPGRSGVSAAGASDARGDDRYAPGPRDVLRRWPAADAAAAAQGRHPERADQCESVFRRVRRAGSEPRRDPDQAGVRALSRQRTDRFQRCEVEQRSDPFEPNRANYQTRTYEGYIGGPIVRNRWGFLAYGGRWEQDDNVVVNATTIDPVTLQPQSLRLNVAAPTRTTSYSFKTDVQVTQNHTAAVEYGQNEQVRRTAGLQSGFDLPERAYTGESREQTASLWVTSASPTVLNELRARVSRNHLVDRAVTDDAGNPRARGVQCRRQSGRAVQGRHDGHGCGWRT